MRHNQQTEFEHLLSMYESGDRIQELRQIAQTSPNYERDELIDALDHVVEMTESLPPAGQLSSVTQAELAAMLKLISSILRAS